MNQLVAFLVLLFAAGNYSVNAQDNKKVKPLPPAQAARKPQTDIQHIALNLKFDWAKKQAIGSATITLMPIAETGNITLDAAMLTIQSVTFSNGVPLTFTYDGSDKNDALSIALDRTYKPGEQIVLQINYHTNWANPTDPGNLWGSYGKGIRFFGPTATEPRERRQAWVNGEPGYNRYWFPGFDDPSDYRTTEFTATVDKELTVISNGVLTEVKNNSDGTRTFHYKTDIPHANHQTSFVIGEYINVKQEFMGIPMNSFSYPDEVEATRSTVVRLTDMAKFFSEKTGHKYPYPSYTQVFVQEYPWGGGNNITFSTISENMVDDHGTHADFFYLWDGVEAQDLAAQWFGNLVTPASWEHAWLSRSFARYFDAQYNQYKNGEEEFQMWNRQFDLSTHLGDCASGIWRPIVTPNYEKAENMVRDNFINSRGPLVLNMLRKQVGEERWWNIIRTYVRRNAGKTVTTQNFQEVVNEVTGESYDWFFNQWVYTIGHPKFTVTKSYNAADKKLTIKLKQTVVTDSASPYPKTRFFAGKMEIAVDGKMEVVHVEPREENNFTFNAAAEPRLVNVDYGGTWIKEMVFEKPLNEWLYQLANDKDVWGRTDALNAVAAIYKDAKTTAADKQRIQSVCNDVIKGKYYWRFRTVVMSQLQSLLRTGRKAALVLDKPTTDMLVSIIKNEKTLVRTAAIFFLGATNDPQYADLYISYLNDESDRVVNAAAFSLGKTKSPKAFNALVKLKDKPSWKNQSLISSLNGLKELADPRGVEIAMNAIKDNPPGARWTLATPVWDYRIAAAITLKELGKSKEGFDIVNERFQKSLEEEDISDIFNNLLLFATLGDERGLEAMQRVRELYKNNEAAAKAVEQYETQLKKALR